MNTYQYQLIAVNQALYSDLKIIFEIRSEAGFTFKLPVLEVAHNAVLLENLSPEDVKRVMFYVNILEGDAQTKKNKQPNVTEETIE